MARTGDDAPPDRLPRRVLRPSDADLRCGARVRRRARTVEWGEFQLFVLGVAISVRPGPGLRSRGKYHSHAGPRSHTAQPRVHMRRAVRRRGRMAKVRPDQQWTAQRYAGGLVLTRRRFVLWLVSH